MRTLLCQVATRFESPRATVLQARMAPCPGRRSSVAPCKGERYLRSWRPPCSRASPDQASTLRAQGPRRGLAGSPDPGTPSRTHRRCELDSFSVLSATLAGVLSHPFPDCRADSLSLSKMGHLADVPRDSPNHHSARDRCQNAKYECRSWRNW
jgi:hypothetical protein